MNTSSSKCPECGGEIGSGVAQGLCPKCLIKRGLGSKMDPSEIPTVPMDSSVAGGKPPPPLEEIAKHFPYLEILEVLGQGGMGVVYKARQLKLDRVVALKILSADENHPASFADRFTREARALAKLNHPGIVSIYDFGQAGQFYYFLMEFVDGANLRQIIHSKKLSSREALGVVTQICEALQYAHDEGIVHRDIKPGNILIDKRGRVKIADFGLAKLLDPAAKDLTLTQAHQIMGTPHYMAPEQIDKPLEVDHRADIYSLGVVFYEMLTGDLPMGRFAPPSQRVQVDVRIDEVVLKSLEQQPDRRYQRAQDVKTDVDSITHSPQAAGIAEPRSSASSSFSWLKHPRAALIAVVVLCCLATLVLVVVTPHPATPNSYLIGAAGRGDLKTIRSILKEGGNANGINANGETALMRAAGLGRLDVVDVLIDKGAKIDTADKRGETALAKAAAAGHDGVVELLLKNNAAALLPNDRLETPLWLAASGGHRKCVQLLVKSAGPEVNQMNNVDWTPLMAAAAKGHAAVVLLLLENKANLIGKADGRDTALSLAEGYEHPDVVQILLDKGAAQDATFCFVRGYKLALDGDHKAAILWFEKEWAFHEDNMLSNELARTFSLRGWSYILNFPTTHLLVRAECYQKTGRIDDAKRIHDKFQKGENRPDESVFRRFKGQPDGTWIAEDYVLSGLQVNQLSSNPATKPELTLKREVTTGGRAIKSETVVTGIIH